MLFPSNSGETGQRSLAEERFKKKKVGCESSLGGGDRGDRLPTDRGNDDLR